MRARRYRGIDLFRIAAALLVVAIHTSPLASYSATADFILTREIARTAVPFFFMASGFFVLGDARRTRAFLKKSSIIYLACIALYLPINVYAGQLKELTLGGLFTQLFFEGTFYHLWYLPAAILGAALSSFLLEKLGQRGAFAAAAALYAFGLLGDSYYGLAAGVPALRAALDAVIAVTGYTRSGLFFAPLFMLLGHGLRTAKPPRRSVCAAALAVTGALLIAEGLVLRSLGWQKHDSMYLMLPFVMYFLFALLASARGNCPRWAADFSLLIYVLHPAVIIAVRGAARILGLWALLVENSLGHYIAVCAATGLISAALLLFARRFAAKCRPDSRAWVEVDADAYRRNARALMSLMPPGQRLMAVLKSNAYGLGAQQAVAALQAEGVRDWAVATAAEGVQLRRCGARGTILILGRTPACDIAVLRRYRLTQAVVSLEHARALSARRCRIDVHIKVDTGMHRLGLPWQDLDGIDSVYDLPYLRVTGMFTHFSSADNALPEAGAFTVEQSQRFFAVVEALRARGRDTGEVHTQSSYGFLNYPDERCALVRAGIALCGVKSADADRADRWPGLQSVLSLRARITEVREVPAGDGAGYDLAFHAQRPTVLAAVPVGYADGIFRAQSGAYALVNGQKAPVAGRICMDQLLLDVTDCGAVRPGDVVTFIGRDGDAEIRAEELAAACGTITNELFSRLGPRLPRVWR